MIRYVFGDEDVQIVCLLNDESTQTPFQKYLRNITIS